MEKRVINIEEKQVLAAEDEYVKAELNRDETVLRRLIDDRFSFNNINGTITGKEELIKGIMNMKMTGQTLGERSVLLEGDVALIFGTTELRFASEAGAEGSKSYYRYTSTYVKRSGDWKLLALQMVKHK